MGKGMILVRSVLFSMVTLLFGGSWATFGQEFLIRVGGL